MSDPYIGEIRLFGFQRIPNGWFACDGSLKPIAEYDTLFALLGTTYGGDGITTFGVPDLRGQLPIHQGTGQGLTPRPLGSYGGTEAVTLTIAQMPQHTHTVYASTGAATTATPSPSVVPASIDGDTQYASNLTGATQKTMATNAIMANAGGLPHDNLMPTLTASFCIAWAGVFPSQS